MGLKEVASRLKGIERNSGIDKQERLLEEVLEIIRQHEIINPGFMQREYWPLCELTHAEIRSMGRGDKTLDDFKDRFKITMQEWYDRRSEWREANYLSAIARFNKRNGDPYQEWELTWPQGGESNLSSPLKRRQGETNGNGKLQ